MISDVLEGQLSEDELPIWLGRRYLVGEAFTVADLAAAAMLSPLLQPPEIQYPVRVELPPFLQDYRAMLLRYPAARWAAEIYRLNRGHSAEVSRRSADANQS